MVRRLQNRIVESIPPNEEADMTTAEPVFNNVADVPWRSPIALACAALGVPREDWRLFSRWADDAASPKAFDELCAYVDVMIADRCRRPTNDLLSHLIQVEADGGELTVDDVHMLVAALVAGSTPRSNASLPGGSHARCTNADLMQPN
jgi:cytochrome P450